MSDYDPNSKKMSTRRGTTARQKYRGETGRKSLSVGRGYSAGDVFNGKTTGRVRSFGGDRSLSEIAGD